MRVILTRLIITVAAVLSCLSAMGHTLRVTVLDGAEDEPIVGASARLIRGEAKLASVSDADGVAIFTKVGGTYELVVEFVGMSGYKQKVTISKDAEIVVKLADGKALNEIVVTATESKGATSSSKIGTEAMRHLQPSSISDVLELLPGGVSTDPKMGEANIVHLRQAKPVSSSEDPDYSTDALGTSFVIDGVPVNTNADMQRVTPSQSGDNADRSTVGKGVDMRSISTDDIESIEVIRGIPSVEYGEITSGVVNIKRKEGVRNLEARFKADMQSRLFYVGKGFKMPADGWTVNVSADYLDSKVDPRNTRENYKRVTGSLRSLLKRPVGTFELSWNSSLNYSGTFERDRNDPDLTINNTVDYYESNNNTFSFNNTLVFTPDKSRWLPTFTFTQGFSYAVSDIHREKTVASSRIYPLPVSMDEGPHYVGYLPMLYLANLDVEGRPMTAFARFAAQYRANTGILGHRLKGGVEWNFSKNYGNGQVYDIARPISAEMTSRPRPFKDIPAENQLSAYVEDMMTMKLGEHQLELMAGLRETQLMNLSSDYYLSWRPYIDPRVNFSWRLQPLMVASQPMRFEFASGIGLHTKMPVAAYLFPDPIYRDFSQLNYYHNEERYRTMNVMTYVVDPTNYDLRAARNLKWEARIGADYRGNSLSVTYFRENMTDGFRQSGFVERYVYNAYDASGFDPYAVDRAPTVEELPYVEEVRQRAETQTTNGSRTLKQGVEYTFKTRRFPKLNTVITINGAWLRTVLDNSQALWYKPTVVVDGKELQYVGLYDDTDGSTYESFNTNIMFDTYVPELKLNFSIAMQNVWYTSSQRHFLTGVPIYYLDPDGVIHKFTEESASDPQLSNLIRHYASAAFDENRVPFASNINFKATKKLFNDRIDVALYVNRILSITPEYQRYGQTIRRHLSPYFGMEINFKI
ncbi:MAG: TonB-dependent receptor plug domain-containing protein [Muribaculaceae bacterium]|nr:TonB-dependent receptor plug domain-containing protein [Muribaculaceae bacterium]